MGKRSAERSAACPMCGKTFARSDTLLRHEKSHHTTEDRGPVHRVTNGTFRACSSCAQARSRCSGGTPCGRCRTRNLECSYPNKRRRGNGFEEEMQSTFQATGSSYDSQPDTASDHQQYPSHFQQFVFAPTSTPPQAGNGQPLDAGKTKSASGISPNPQMQLHPQQPTQTHPELNVGLSLNNPEVQHMSSIGSDLHNMTGVPQMSGLEQYGNTSAPVDYPNAFNGQHVPFNENGLYEDALNLNWLPLSIYSSPYGDMEHDFSFLLPSLSDTGSMSNSVGTLALDTSLDTLEGVSNLSSMASPAYRPPASTSGLMQSPTSSSSDAVAPIGFSFDNVEIPGSKKKRRNYPHIPSGFPHPKEMRTEFSFPDASALSPVAQHVWCSEDKYSLVIATFHRLCVDSSRWTPFSNSDFPTFAAFNTCIDLYFEHLHPTFPLIHTPTFEYNADWLICLAVAAIGSTFASIPHYADLREAFQEFLRRAVLATSDQHDGDFRNIHLAQARILALVGLAQSDREQLRSRAPRSHVDIARWCLESSILQLTAQDEEVGSDEDIQAAWNRWVQRESLRRVGYFIWYLDCALGYIGNARPLCNLDDARAPLPCSEALWNASTAEEWLKHRNNKPPMPSLCAALEMLYTKKKVDPNLSEVSHILLIHALYSRTWEVGTHIKQPLSEWKATDNAAGFLNTPSKDSFWLPLYPLYANWRNSACDCLDVLHWHASAVTARNAGAEHHGILHLHLARVILLTPFQEIQDLLFFLINHRVSDLSKASFYVHDGSYQPRNPAKLPQIRKITWRWLREDQHKARLAMVHAGSVFWHVRRHSKHSFFEPLAIYLASIVLWTYGSYKSAALERDANTGHQSSNSKSAQTKSSLVNPNINSDQVPIGAGNSSEIQPTRIERAMQDYADSPSQLSQSRTARNIHTTDINSPAQPHSHLGLDNLSPVNPSHPVPDLNPTYSSDNEEDQDETHGDDDDNDDSESESESDDQPTFIHLDRPCDDEIIQHFIRNGHNMSGYMSNVDICKTPQKVLLEGAKILRTKLACWGVSREYHDILVRLAEVRKDKDKDGNKSGNRSKERSKGAGFGSGSGEREGFKNEDDEINHSNDVDIDIDIDGSGMG